MKYDLLARNVRNKLAEARITTAAFAKTIDMDKDLLNKLLHNDRQMGIPELFKIAKGLGVSMESLLEGCGI